LENWLQPCLHAAFHLRKRQRAYFHLLQYFSVFLHTATGNAEYGSLRTRFQERSVVEKYVEWFHGLVSRPQAHPDGQQTLG